MGAERSLEPAWGLRQEGGAFIEGRRRGKQPLAKARSCMATTCCCRMRTVYCTRCVGEDWRKRVEVSGSIVVAMLHASTRRTEKVMLPLLSNHLQTLQVCSQARGRAPLSKSLSVAASTFSPHAIPREWRCLCKGNRLISTQCMLFP